MAPNATSLTRLSILMFVRNYSVEPEGEKGCLLFANGARQNKVTVMKQKLICAGFLKLVSAIFYQIFVFS